MAASQVQALLRFLSQDAKVPLTTAMGKANELVKAGLTTPENISKVDLKPLQDIFKDAKVAKQILNAANRVSRKRAAPTESAGVTPQKRPRARVQEGTTTPYATECALALPITSATEEELSNIVLFTNRAPLVLAFAVCVLRYTMPEQPISSRLSLAQAVVSANSRSKAVSLGIESGPTVEGEDWGEGQPTVSVLGRDTKVLKRWDYNPREGRPEKEAENDPNDILGDSPPVESEPAPPLWGIDVETINRAHGSDGGTKAGTVLPIHTPQSARSYLLKAFSKAATESAAEPGSSKKKKSQAQDEAEREACLGHLLRSIDTVCRSWASTLTKDELDSRAWAWYVRVRPSVRSGAEGWGEKGAVRLSQILALKRQ